MFEGVKDNSDVGTMPIMICIKPDIEVTHDREIYRISLKHHVLNNSNWGSIPIIVMDDILYTWEDDEESWIPLDEFLQKAYRDYIVEQELLEK